jgi:hypothetical protein
MAEDRFSFPPALRGTWAETGDPKEKIMRNATRGARAGFTAMSATLSVFNFSALAR